MRKYRQLVPLGWVLNNLIHNWHTVKIFKKIFDPMTGIYDCTKILCELWDDYYKEHKEEINNLVVDFISVRQKDIHIIVKWDGA